MVKAERRKRITVPEEVAAWIESRAKSQGLTKEEYVDKLLSRAIKRTQDLEDELSFTEKGANP